MDIDDEAIENERADNQVWVSKEIFKELLDAQYHLARNGKAPSKKSCVEASLKDWFKKIHGSGDSSEVKTG